LDTGQAEAPDEGCTGTVKVRRDGDRILLLLPSREAVEAPRWEAA
jgi:hypothetical protein